MQNALGDKLDTALHLLARAVEVSTRLRVVGGVLLPHLREFGGRLLPHFCEFRGVVLPQQLK